jgi:hypothetical protein
MQPNPYLLEKYAALRESELQQRARYAHLRLPVPARTLGERARVLILIGVVFSCGMLGALLQL